MRRMRLWPVILAVSCETAAAAVPGPWQDVANRCVLTNAAMEARFQSGIIYRLTDRATGQVLLDADAAALPSEPRIFGKSGINLDACAVSQQVTADAVTVEFSAPDGTTWRLEWTLEAGRGDLVLRTSARAPGPVETFFVVFRGCDIEHHAMVTVGNIGECRIDRAPWDGEFLWNAETVSAAPTYVQPIVALFEGEGAGWFLEGREQKVGPANVLARGHGASADVGLVRGYPIPTTTPEMYEIRVRTYAGQWEDAADPYIDWLEHGLGLIPLERKQPAWVRQVRTQAHVPVGDFEGLEALAKRLDPAQTFIGRRINYRHHGMDINWPDYRLTDTARNWIKRAHELGFRVGFHVSLTGVDPSFPDLVEQFRPSFRVIGTDADDNEQYQNCGLRHIYASAAYKPWREFLIAQVKEMVDAGVDAIHLDEAHTPTGKLLIDGMTAIEGVMTLEKELLEAYPHIAIQSEQFNPMAVRWASFAFGVDDFRHPLGGYLFSRFIRIVPEGWLYSPMDLPHMDALMTFGYMVPGAHVGWDEAWLRIARAYQDYELEPAPRLPRKPNQIFGFRGRNGVTAYYEKGENKQGLVVYVPGEDPREIGMRRFGLRVWPGPGGIRDWPAYRGNTLFGLDPAKTYWMDETVTLPQDHFHVTRAPDDFLLHQDMYLDFRPEDAGHDMGPGGAYYRLKCIGHGEIELSVPGPDYLVFVDGVPAPLDPVTRRAQARIEGSAEDLSIVWAFRKTDGLLEGKVAALPWQVPPRQRDGHFFARGDDFGSHVSGSGILIGRLPDAKKIALEGAYAMREDAMLCEGDGVVRINGKEILRIPPGPRPYQTHAFDVDISEFAGRHVLIEFNADGFVRALALANWFGPRITAQP